jgi:flavin-dependent dehydrogenase
MSDLFDLIVVGAGPAGSASAITAARKGAKVLLLEKDEFPRHKVCGEFVSFESLDLLDRLLQQRLAGHPITHVRLFRNRETWSSRLPRPAVSVTRYELDDCLAHTARASGVVLIRTRVRSISKQDDQNSVITDQGEFYGRVLVNAAGRWSELQARTNLSGEKLIGLKQHFNGESSSNSTDLYFFPGGYCGVQPVGEGKVNVCALVDPAAASTLNVVFARSKPLFHRAIKWEPVSELFATAPIFFAPPQPLTGDMINVGDAAAFIDPFLGDGISIALQTGVLAGECALQANGLNRYRREYKKRVVPALRRASRLRRLLGSQLAWKVMRVPGVISLAARSTRVRVG